VRRGPNALPFRQRQLECQDRAASGAGAPVAGVNAAVPDIEVVFVGEPDRVNVIGIKGIGEIGVIGVGAAISAACLAPEVRQ
jgi:hypothetical protein